MTDFLFQRRGLRALAFLLALLVCAFALSSCSPKVHRYCEIGLKLPSRFETTEAQESFDLALSDGRLFVGILRISFEAAVMDGIPATMTPLKFAEYYLDVTEKADKATPITEHGDVPYYTYIEENNGARYLFVPSFYFSIYAYFVITFITPIEEGEAPLGEILSYTETVFISYPDD